MQLCLRFPTRSRNLGLSANGAEPATNLALERSLAGYRVALVYPFLRHYKSHATNINVSNPFPTLFYICRLSWLASIVLMTQFTIHTSALFDPKTKAVRNNVSLTVDTVSGLIVKVFERADGDGTLKLEEGDIDLRGKYVLPGLVDAHTHVFLHSYE